MPASQHGGNDVRPASAPARAGASCVRRFHIRLRGGPVTTTEPNAGDTQRGRHSKSHDPDRNADAADDDREPAHAQADDQEPHGSSRAEVADDDSPADDEPETPAAGDESDEPPAD